MKADPVGRPAKAVLFDLDGTLLDTAPDMIGALNRLRTENGRDPLAFEHLRPSVSHGSARLVRVGFPELPDERLPALQQRFLDIYRDNLSAGTHLFPGMAETLDALESRRLALGIVTNKPGWLTQPLLLALGLADRFACVISGDTFEQRKPHPLPLLHAATRAGADAGDCLYIGDAERDIQAARAAGMSSLIAHYGYLGPDDRPADWSADGDLATPADLLPWMQENGRL